VPSWLVSESLGEHWTCTKPIGDLADYFGRRITIISGCLVFSVGAILQTASTGLGLMVAGRLIAGFGVGFVSAVIILYLSEIAPRKVRGAIVSGYQFCITIGILFANCVVYSTQERRDTGSYRIPVAVQFLWAIILGVGLFLLPESPRWYVKKGRVDAAAVALGRVRGQPADSDYVSQELAEIIANHEYETELIPSSTYFGSWAACFSGSIANPGSNLRRTALGISLQAMQQLTGTSLYLSSFNEQGADDAGINFIFVSSDAEKYIHHDQADKTVLWNCILRKAHHLTYVLNGN
jgi:SP family sugar:H+ symporter-like MFS transporter